MKSSKPKFTAEQIADAATSAIEKQIWHKAFETEKPPARFKQTFEWAKIWGKCDTQTRKLMFALVTKGLMERKVFTAQAGTRMIPVPHYAVVK